MEIRDFSKVGNRIDIPNLMRLQVESYERFLQSRVSPQNRKNQGLEAVLRETFPIESYDKKMYLEYIKYELGPPRYESDECRRLKLTYGAPFKIRVRLNKGNIIEEDVYLGEIPIMVGGGEFIVNGAERVIVSQLHRSPGVDFTEDIQPGERRLHGCRIIPERGSWVEMNVTKKDQLVVRIDQSGKMPVTMFLRAISPEYGTNEDIIRLFYPTEVISVRSETAAERLKGRHVVGDVIDEKTGELILESGGLIAPGKLKGIMEGAVKRVEVIKHVDDMLILNTLAEDPTHTHEEALLRIYARIRPGNPPQAEKARRLFHEKFSDGARYRLGRVGRFRINRKFGLNVPETVMTLTKDDVLNAVSYILALRRGEGEVDDIDHLGNRRVRTIDELVSDEFRRGFLKLRRTVQERMSLQDPDSITPRSVINSKTISAAIEYFFGRGELSQVVDQHNPLAQLTHERRLSALGPGGLNRKRAGFEVRDVHISHYGRICPIETPEGTNIGLISSLSVFAEVDEYGFLVTPYCKVKAGRPTDEVVMVRADQEIDVSIAPVDSTEGRHKFASTVLARLNGDFLEQKAGDVSYLDVSPIQMLGVSAALIPFLEHNDANRALMGSNMQRQAVPLLVTEPPLVATGMERHIAANSGMVVRAEEDGVVEAAEADHIQVNGRRYDLRKFFGLNDRTCLNQRPIVHKGDRVKKGQILADGAATYDGELALGRNVLVAFMPWDGYNFEDAILISESLVKHDKFTSIHIDEFDIEIRETKLGREEFTRDIPNVSEKALRNLDEKGIVRVGTYVRQGDILVGKVAPKSKNELSPEEKLLIAIFGKGGEDVKNDSLEVPSGVEGIVIDTRHYSRKIHLTEEDRRKNQRKIREIRKEINKQIIAKLEELYKGLRETLGGAIIERETDAKIRFHSDLNEQEIRLFLNRIEPSNLVIHGKRQRDACDGMYYRYVAVIDKLENERDRRINEVMRGDELPPGVLETVKVYIATKRMLSVGDKMAGRHGNKGVIAKILPEEDMPFLEDGTPIQIVLNPLGVPSRMNVGQILETHLGWACRALGFQAVTPPFDGANEDEIQAALEECGLPKSGKVTLLDGRTGEPFDQQVTVGYIYMMKLHHLVDDKVHARATGPYSLITQQPLGGKARFGGQRFGEMEVWALEAYGAASTLQELLTVKSDDVEGRTKIYESMVKGENTLEPGTPMSFEVLTSEIKGLGLNMELHKKRV
ncbi:MAG: DNA-directed RNA polymerase subunit beta [Planctomycetota bacterium]|nr:MAG: DNA-directed RNA polymerase subunit beta [Planctomycetota bacterium]